MKTRTPCQAQSTEGTLKSIIPSSFKMVNDKSSNGYKYFNMLFGIEADQAKEYLQEVYNNSFLTSMDFGATSDVYEVYLSGLAGSQYLNSNGIPIKIVNNGSPGGEAEFWEGTPTRLGYVGKYNLPTGVLPSGHITGTHYLRSNISGYGYFLIGMDISHSDYNPASGSVYQFNVNTTGTILSNSGMWPGLGVQKYETTGSDEVLTPLGSGYLSRTYPLTRSIRDDSGVFWDIDFYEPDLGWVRDPNWNAVAKVDYNGEFYYDGDGKKIYYRVANNNPFGVGNFTSEYLHLNNIPISGTLKIYDMDILDASGNATEIPSSGITLYYKGSSEDPVYVGYDSTVPQDVKFGSIAGLSADALTVTSWSYQREGGYIDEGTHGWIEGSGSITSAIKITNPYSRYIAEYKYKVFDTAKYITSLDASRYVAYDTRSPIYSIKSNNNNIEQIPYEFTRDPRYVDSKSMYLTFDGWTTRPGSKMSRVDFNIPILIESGPIAFKSFQQRKSYIGYTSDFVPQYTSPKTFALDCPFDQPIVSGLCDENGLTWVSDGGAQLYKTLLDKRYSKTVRYTSGTSSFYSTSAYMGNNTFFRIDFQLIYPSNVTLIDLTDATHNSSIKIEIKTNGMLEITSNGTHIESRYRFEFDDNPKSLIVQTFQDREFTGDPVFNVYVKDKDSFTKMDLYSESTNITTINTTTLDVLKNSTASISKFQIWDEALTWQV